MPSDDPSDLLIGSATLILILGALLLFADRFDDGHQLWPCVLSGITGSALGWGIGIMCSPYNASERDGFAGVGKVVTGFLTGFVITKISPVIDALTKDPTKIPWVVVVYAAVGLTALVAVWVFTYVSRAYWRSGPA